jgi:hypothetical protein
MCANRGFEMPQNAKRRPRGAPLLGQARCGAGFYPPRQSAYLQSGRPAAAAGRSADAVEPDPAEVEDMPELLVVPLPLVAPALRLGVLVVVLVLPVCVVVTSRTCLLAASQHLPWLTDAEGVVVVVVV